MQQPCLFCRIIERDTPADFMHEVDLVVAFGPSATGGGSLSGRTQKHLGALNDLMPEDSPVIGQMFQIAKKLGGAIEYPRKCYRTVFSVNAWAVYHMHFARTGREDVQLAARAIGRLSICDSSMENIHEFGTVFSGTTT